MSWVNINFDLLYHGITFVDKRYRTTVFDNLYKSSYLYVHWLQCKAFCGIFVKYMYIVPRGPANSDS